MNTKTHLTIILCAAAMLTLSGCKKNENRVVTPLVSTSSSKGSIYKEPVASNGSGATIVDGQANPVSKPTSANAQTTSDIAEDYEFEDDLGGVNILRYRGTDEKVTIPSMINKKAVLKIDEHAFRGSSVKSVVIPSSVKTIETHAFSGCDNLESLTLSEGVEVIDGYAFADCPKLALVSLPDSIREINSGAFNSCPNLMLTYKGQTYTAVNVEDLYDIF